MNRREKEGIEKAIYLGPRSDAARTLVEVLQPRLVRTAFWCVMCQKRTPHMTVGEFNEDARCNECGSVGRLAGRRRYW